jgi:hypothetical protein
MRFSETLNRFILPIGLGLAVFSFIVYKAAVVQVTCDEAYTLAILPKVSVWDLVTYADSYTNNHILNTLLVKLNFHLFGMNQMAGRLPNILAFGLYFLFAWQFSRRFFSDSWMALLFIVAMLGNPYLIDFFSLARGYGLSIGLMMPSIYYAAIYIESRRTAAYPLPLSIFFAILSVYAQFASLHFYLGLNLTLLLFHLFDFLKTRDTAHILRGGLIQILGFVLLVALVYLPFKAILRDNQISYYGADNIWDNTFKSLVYHSLYNQGYFAADTVPVFRNLLAILFILLTINGIHVFRQGGKSSPCTQEVVRTVFSLLSLASTAGVVVAQFYLFGTQYVVDRTALFFYPLIALNIPSIAQLFGRQRVWAGRLVAALFIVFCIWHVCRSVNKVSFREWWFDKNTFDVVATLKAEQAKMAVKRPLDLHTHWMFQPSFFYHHEAAKWDAIIQKPAWQREVDTVKIHDFYYIFNEELPALTSRYEVFKVYDDGAYLLLKKR